MHMEYVITVVDVLRVSQLPIFARGVGGGRDSARHSRRVLAAETSYQILEFYHLAIGS